MLSQISKSWAIDPFATFMYRPKIIIKNRSNKNNHISSFQCPSVTRKRFFFCVCLFWKTIESIRSTPTTLFPQRCTNCEWNFRVICQTQIIFEFISIRKTTSDVPMSFHRLMICQPFENAFHKMIEKAKKKEITMMMVMVEIRTA